MEAFYLIHWNILIDCGHNLENLMFKFNWIFLVADTNHSEKLVACALIGFFLYSKLFKLTVFWLSDTTVWQWKRLSIPVSFLFYEKLVSEIYVLDILVLITLYHTSQNFDNPEEELLKKTLWEKEKMLTSAFNSVPHNPEFWQSYGRSP